MLDFMSGVAKLSWSVCFTYRKTTRSKHFRRDGKRAQLRFMPGSPFTPRTVAAFINLREKDNIFCVANLGHIEQIIDWLGEETTLDNQRVDILDGSPQPLAALAHTADVDRDVNLLFNTNFIRSSRDSLYPPRLQPLHAAITWFLGPGENIQAGLLSLNLSESFFCELQLFCARDKQPEHCGQRNHYQAPTGGITD